MSCLRLHERSSFRKVDPRASTRHTTRGMNILLQHSLTVQGKAAIDKSVGRDRVISFVKPERDWGKFSCGLRHLIRARDGY